MTTVRDQSACVWHRIEYQNVKEKHLQDMFDAWPDQQVARLIGAPDWLSILEVAPSESRQRRRETFGYTFIPDVEFIAPPIHYVLELKHGAKYEPLALAEVLHHAAWIRHHERSKASIIVPVIIASFNYWLRLAIDSLPRDMVRYYEADVLTKPASLSGPESLVVLDAPLAPWLQRESAPPWLAGICTNDQLIWHEVAETGGWFGFQSKQGARPLILTERFVYAAHHAADNLVVVWEGHPDPKQGPGAYFLGEPGKHDPAGRANGPTWLASEP